MGGEASKARVPAKDEKQSENKLHANSTDPPQDSAAHKRMNTSNGSGEHRRQSLDSKTLLSQFRERLKTNQEAKPDAVESMKQFNPSVS